MTDSMTDPTTAFAKFMPGFDFMQSLVKGAGAAMPGMGQWVAPTLDPEALEKRIEELRTVQFWLEQNARLLGATVQALEVQRMTLSTLKTMNVSFGDLTESLKIKPSAAPAAATAFATAPAPAPAPAKPEANAPASGVPASVVDPMQWWGALTQQFSELASKAMQDGAGGAARNLAGQMVQQGMDAAGQTLKAAAAMPAAVVKSAVDTAVNTAAGVVGKSAAKPGSAQKRTPTATKASPARKSAPKSAPKR